MSVPAYADWDFGTLKNFKVTESKQFQFRAELFNILNRHELPFARLRHQFANIQPYPCGGGSAPGAVCIEVHVLSQAGTCHRGVSGLRRADSPMTANLKLNQSL